VQFAEAKEAKGSEGGGVTQFPNRKVWRMGGLRRLAIVVAFGSAAIIIAKCAGVGDVDYGMRDRLTRDLRSGSTRVAWELIETNRPIYHLWVMCALTSMAADGHIPNSEVSSQDCNCLLDAAIAGHVAHQHVYRQFYDSQWPSVTSWMVSPDDIGRGLFARRPRSLDSQGR
jgi:hypothetical protein